MHKEPHEYGIDDVRLFEPVAWGERKQSALSPGRVVTTCSMERCPPASGIRLALCMTGYPIYFVEVVGFEYF